MAFIQRSPEPFFYEGGKTGILLIHGFTGSASELRPMGEYFHKLGYTVHAPLLKGHGTKPEDMRETSWQDWWQSALHAYDRLNEHELDHLYVAGLSMGGCLALNLAAHKQVDGVISMNAPMWIQDRLAFLSNFFHPFVPYRPRGGGKPPEVEAHLVPYDRTPVKSVSEILKLIKTVRKQLVNITVPALIVQSSVDETVQPRSAQYIYEHISTPTKTLSWYDHSGHIITVDKERKKLFAEVEKFIETNNVKAHIVNQE
ncbi:alpha/beta fold hydrolase [Hazenella sp. IB182357]|uniref:Alpha/beta fold hydrolase n=1 Tax=Polycladospora coralii TaxID=2771432 RepID=A0A926NBH0_9BACL|nr:alpha/beta fold hydrolase [Polycladospora coralii]MBD1372260.1 alpha/beta fold hydrolase [Polycladospora coralii]MBS7530759.1 alpha/beta fold hydrolase [Polycladospora coralii]